VSEALCCNCKWNIFSHSSTITPQLADVDNRVIQIYQQRLNSKTYVPSTTFGRATLGADGVANKLFIAFLFSDPDVGVQLLKDMGLIQSSMVCCKCGSQMSWCVDTNRNDVYRWRCRRKTPIGNITGALLTDIPQRVWA
jgi:hypothetical protein